MGRGDRGGLSSSGARCEMMLWSRGRQDETRRNEMDQPNRRGVRTIHMTNNGQICHVYTQPVTLFPSQVRPRTHPPRRDASQEPRLFARILLHPGPLPYPRPSSRSDAPRPTVAHLRVTAAPPRVLAARLVPPPSRSSETHRLLLLLCIGWRARWLVRRPRSSMARCDPRAQGQGSACRVGVLVSEPVRSGGI